MIQICNSTPDTPTTIRVTPVANKVGASLSSSPFSVGKKTPVNFGDSGGLSMPSGETFEIQISAGPTMKNKISTDAMNIDGGNTSGSIRFLRMAPSGFFTDGGRK